jgi:hypothetical protein
MAAPPPSTASAPPPPPAAGEEALVRGFNLELKLLTRWLASICMEGQLLVMAYKLAKAMGRRVPQRQFHDLVVLPHLPQLLAHDETFFLEPGFRVATVPECITMCARDCWERLSRADRDAVWARLDRLVDLSRRLEG